MKYVKIISLMLFAVLLVGCGRDLNNITSKTSYVMNEKASMDKLEITLKKEKCDILCFWLFIIQLPCVI